jgi:hypothetical protein
MLSKLDIAIEHAIHLTYINSKKIHRCTNCNGVMIHGKSKGREAEICFSCRQLEIQGEVKYKGWRIC